MQSPTNKPRIFCILCVAMLSMVSAANAIDYTWVGTISSDWFDARNWSAGGATGVGVPIAPDTATVPAHAIVTVNSDVSVTNLYLGDDSTLTGFGNVTASNTLTV